MSDSSLSNQATNPDKSVVASEHTQPIIPNVSGSATLNAQTATGENYPEDDPTDFPIATNEYARPLTPNVSGSATLDAQTATGENYPEGDPTDFPIATNFSKANAAGDFKAVTASTEMGPFSNGYQPTNKSQVKLQNNSNVPDQRMQGNLPDTDSIGMPIDSDTNLPD